MLNMFNQSARHSAHYSELALLRLLRIESAPNISTRQNSSMWLPKFVIYWSYFATYAAKQILVGYLTADRTLANHYVKNLQGRIISGAMTHAVERINRNPDLLPNYNISFLWDDTFADTLTGTGALTRQWRHGATAFFGPEDSCDVEARVAASWNLPMISYVSFSTLRVWPH